MSDESRRVMAIGPDWPAPVTVKVAPEILTELLESWSLPVQVMITFDLERGYEMVCRTVVSRCVPGAPRCPGSQDV